MSKRKYCELNVGQKIEVVKNFEEEYLSQRQLAKKFKVSKSQIQRILATKQELQTYLQTFPSLKRKRFNTTQTFSEIDSLTFKWFSIAREKRRTITGAILQRKARYIARTLAVENFAASNGWLEAFKSRHNIDFRTEGDIKSSATADFKETLAKLCDGYNPKDIFSLDETGLLFKATPSRTDRLKNEKCSDGELAKERFTVALLCNALGDKEPPLIIGTSPKPNAFKNTNIEKVLDVIWRSDSKAWMTTQLFNEWITLFDQNMQKQNRKVILFAKNIPCHIASNLRNIELKFFPPNITCPLQPFDQGIIKSFKSNYRKCLIQNLSTFTDDGRNETELSDKINSLDAVTWLKQAWAGVTSNSIQNCFEKCGFGDFERIEETVTVDENLPSGLSESFILVDKNVLTSQGWSANWEKDFFRSIQNRPKKAHDHSHEESLSDDESHSKPGSSKISTYKEACSYIDILKDFSSENGLNDLWSGLQNCSRLLSDAMAQNNGKTK